MKWNSYPTYYAQVHGHALRDVRPVGRKSARIFFADHPGGEIKIPATPDLLVVFLAHLPKPGVVDFGDKKLSIGGSPEGGFVLCPPNADANVMVDGQHQTLTLAIPYQELLVSAGVGHLLPLDGNFGELHQATQSDAAVIRIVAQIWAESKQADPFTSLATEGLVLQLVSRLIQLKGLKAKNRVTGLADWQVRRVTDYVLANMDEEITLSKLSQLFNLCPQYFCTAFALTVGQPPYRWLRMLRIERAKALLTDRKLNMNDIAFSIGFSSQSSFSTAFRKATGMTPSSYRRFLD